MSYPQQDIPYSSFLNYANTEVVTNGEGDITGAIMNNILNALYTYITQAPLNGDKVALVSQNTAYTATTAITFFTGGVPSSVTFGTNRYNEWVFINTTNSNIPFSTGLGYFDINFSFNSFIPAKSILRIAQAVNGQWVLTGLYGNATSPSIPKPIIGVAGRGQSQDPTTGTSYYINSALVQFAAANGYKFIINVNGAVYQNFGANGNQFVFDETTGRIDFDPFSFVWEAGGSLYIDRNQ